MQVVKDELLRFLSMCLLIVQTANENVISNSNNSVSFHFEARILEIEMKHSILEVKIFKKEVCQFR